MMTDDNSLLRLALRLREMAGDSQLPYYTTVMIRAARELETHVCELQAGRLAVPQSNSQDNDHRSE
jgi:hypothetical protein